MKKERWYFFDTGHRNPFFNMAMDEALMNWSKKNNSVILRFFNFRPRSITIGYLQKVGKWLLKLEKTGIKWVRRPTGGRAVFHSRDFTYSLIFPEHHHLIGGTVLESYKKIAKAFNEVFQSMGLDVELKRERGDRKIDYCFGATSWYEFTFNGKKIIGSAQVRKKEIVLQQGTVMLDKPGKPYPDVKGMITIKESLKRDFSLEDMKEIVYLAFKKVFPIEFIPVNQKFYIQDLLNKYQSYEWNYAKKGE